MDHEVTRDDVLWLPFEERQRRQLEQDRDDLQRIFAGFREPISITGRCPACDGEDCLAVGYMGRPDLRCCAVCYRRRSGSERSTAECSYRLSPELLSPKDLAQILVARRRR